MFRAEASEQDENRDINSSSSNSSSSGNGPPNQEGRSCVVVSSIQGPQILVTAKRAAEGGVENTLIEISPDGSTLS